MQRSSRIAATATTSKPKSMSSADLSEGAAVGTVSRASAVASGAGGDATVPCAENELAEANGIGMAEGT